jgi:hypothetical protein
MLVVNEDKFRKSAKLMTSRSDCFRQHDGVPPANRPAVPSIGIGNDMNNQGKA